MKGEMESNNISCSLSVSRNFLNYYFVKWGLKKRSKLVLNTTPDNIVLDICRNQIKHNKGLMKSIFRLVKEKNIQFDKDNNKMTVYSRNKEYSKELDLDIDALATIEKLLSVPIDFKEFDNDLLLVQFKEGVKFAIRKTPVSVVETLQETVMGGEYSFLYPYVKDKVVLDAGAFIGDTAVMFCANGAKRVVAYEPDPVLYTLCTTNANLNNMSDKIEVKNYGVGDKECVLNEKGYSFVDPELSFTGKGAVNDGNVNMKILPFSEIIQKMDNVDVLKIDCEGAEFPAILSTPPDILKKIKVIGMEYHANPETLINYLQASDFKVEIKKEIEKDGDKHLGILFAIQKSEIS